ncbi:MAG: aldehyde dehydrogenase family protein [Acidobacteria bacterium]|nr:aldehyde dehydrogenase family protein [Acidobacteriota bacterium]
MKTYPLIAGGHQLETQKKQSVTDKYSGETFAEVSVAGDNELDMALKAAEKAGPAMAALPAHERSRIISDAGKKLAGKADELAETISREAGKPLKYAKGEVARCLENLTFAAEEAKRIHGETLPLDASTAGENRMGFYERFPIGIVAAISPFNFPLNLAAHKVAPAIAAGCPVILKPAGLTPLSGIELIRAFVEAGAPEGALSVLPGPGSIVGENLITDARIAKITFTGSRMVGTHITRVAGLKKVTMELGANSGVVVDKDCSRMDYAVKRCVLGAYYNQGQVCISVQRIFVHEKNIAEFTNKFITATEKLIIGNPIDETTDVGPIISEPEIARIENWLAEARKQGAEILIGGKREGNVLTPAVIVNARPDMRVMKEELFAPAVVIHPISSFEEGIRLLDDSSYGLQAGIFTDNVDKALDAVRHVNVGGVIINDIPAFRVDHMPYGGNKGSGLGREGAKFAIEDMTTLRMVVFNRNRD